MVLMRLLSTLSHSNFNDMEASLNATTVLTELIELPATLELFFLNNAKIVETAIQLAIDPSNGFNQQYLLTVLLAICKQIKPGSQANTLFKDLEDEDETQSDKNKFDPETPQSKQMLAFLGLVKKHDLIYNLLIMINNKGTYTGGASRY